MHFDSETHQNFSHPSPHLKKPPLWCLIHKGSVGQTCSGNYTKCIYPLSLRGKLYSSVMYKRSDSAYNDISHVPGVTHPPLPPRLGRCVHPLNSDIELHYGNLGCMRTHIHTHTLIVSCNYCSYRRHIGL